MADNLKGNPDQKVIKQNGKNSAERENIETEIFSSNQDVVQASP